MAVATKIEQLPADTNVEAAWPRRVLELSPEELTERGAVSWTRGADELGDYDIAVVTAEGEAPPLVLQAYLEAPEREILVLTNEAAPDDAIDRVLAALDV